MAHAAVRFRVRTGILVGILTIVVMTTVSGWASTLLGEDRPLGVSVSILLGLTLAAGLVTLAGRQIAALLGLGQDGLEVARMRQDLEFARRIQERFLPQSLPVVPGIDLWGENWSSQEVSGDYYDIHDGGGARPLVLAIADVSGKGVPAALLMSAVQAGFHSHLLQGEFSLERTMQNLNCLVHQDAHTGRFVTMLLAEFDKTTRRLRYVRAGHDLPLIVSSDGSVRRLADGNLFLGFMPDVEYRAAAVDLSPGDILCLYTDGVTEAIDAAGQPFDEARLVDVLLRNRGRSAAEIGRAVLDAVSAHSRLPRQADDVTLVIMKVFAGIPDACATDPQLVASPMS